MAPDRMAFMKNYTNKKIKLKQRRRSTKLIQDFEAQNTVKFSLYKDYKASKDFRGTGEWWLYYTVADPDLQIRGGGRGTRSSRP